MCLESSLKCVKLTRNSRTFPLNDAVSGYDGRQTEKIKVNLQKHPLFKTAVFLTAHTLQKQEC